MVLLVPSNTMTSAAWMETFTELPKMTSSAIQNWPISWSAATHQTTQGILQRQLGALGLHPISLSPFYSFDLHIRAGRNFLNHFSKTESDKQLPVISAKVVQAPPASWSRTNAEDAISQHRQCFSAPPILARPNCRFILLSLSTLQDTLARFLELQWVRVQHFV